MLHKADLHNVFVVVERFEAAFSQDLLLFGSFHFGSKYKFYSRLGSVLTICCF